MIPIKKFGILQKPLSRVYNSNNIVIVSRDEYAESYYNGFIIYCLPSESKKISQLINSSSECDFYSIALSIQSSINEGIFAICSAKTVIMGCALFSDSFSWNQSGDTLYISDSSKNIALLLSLPISQKVLAINLIESLPYYPFNKLSMWEGIERIHPLSILSFDHTGALSQKQIWQAPVHSQEIDKICFDVRKRLIDILKKYDFKYSNISSDISGGVDSSAIAFFLKSLNIVANLYHMATDNESNTDSISTKKIVSNLNFPLTSTPSMSQIGRKFVVNQDYYGASLPDYPIFWSDTEGYVEQIFNSVPDGKSIHFTGIGGDELFLQTPSFVWSYARQNNKNLVAVLVNYCKFMRVPIHSCVRNVLRSTTYNDALLFALDLAFNDKKPSVSLSDQNWLGTITIPNWITKFGRYSLQEAVSNTLSEPCTALDADRSRHQVIESLLYQNRLMNELNFIYGNGKMHWKSPFLDRKIVNSILSVPVKYHQIFDVNKPILYKISNGIVPREIFTRQVKGEYSVCIYNALYQDLPSILPQIYDFKTVQLGLVDPDILKSELSMPTHSMERVHSFARVTAIERWLNSVANHKMLRF